MARARNISALYVPDVDGAICYECRLPNFDMLMSHENGTREGTLRAAGKYLNCGNRRDTKPIGILKWRRIQE